MAWMGTERSRKLSPDEFYLYSLTGVYLLPVTQFAITESFDSRGPFDDTRILFSSESKSFLKHKFSFGMTCLLASKHMFEQPLNITTIFLL